MAMEKKRIAWVDAVKFIGIFCIYLGHLGESAGRAYLFVFQFHVPLFFFLSGCMESLNTETSLAKNIKKKAVNLVIPFYFFAVFSIILWVFSSDYGMRDILPRLIQVVKGGVRNKFFAGSLWFLTCLFSMSALFEFVKKVRNKCGILLLCIASYICAERLLPFRPIATPQWWYNVDSALYYLLYYGLGYVCFGPINNILEKQKYRPLVALSGILAGVYAVFLFFDHNLLMYFAASPQISLFIPVVTALIMIWFCIVLAFVCGSWVDVWKEIGKNTLYMCGSEYAVKLIVPAALEIVGIKVEVPNLLGACIYSYFLLILVNRYFVPVEKRAIAALKGEGKKKRT